MVLSLVVLSLVMLSGCLPFQGKSTRQIIQNYNPFGLTTSVTKDKIVLRTVLLERPTGDPYLCTDLWTSTMKPLPPETAALLAENGLRVGTFPSNAPADLLERINAGDGTVRPSETTANFGEAKVLPINGPIPQSTFQVFDDIGAKPNWYEMTNVSFGLAVTGTTENGKLKLVFEPKAQHGDRQGWLRPTLDGIGFVRQDQKEIERFSKLAFELAILPGEYLVIGPTEQPATKAGGAMFVTDANGGSRMRVLVVRAWRGPEAPSEPLPGRRLPDSTRK